MIILFVVAPGSRSPKKLVSDLVSKMDLSFDQLLAGLTSDKAKEPASSLTDQSTSSPRAPPISPKIKDPVPTHKLKEPSLSPRIKESGTEGRQVKEAARIKESTPGSSKAKDPAGLSPRSKDGSRGKDSTSALSPKMKEMSMGPRLKETMSVSPRMKDPLSIKIKNPSTSPSRKDKSVSPRGAGSALSPDQK